jgi:hypothetical protein
LVKIGQKISYTLPEELTLESSKKHFVARQQRQAAHSNISMETFDGWMLLSSTRKSNDLVRLLGRPTS